MNNPTEVREFVRMAFAELGIEIEFKGKKDKETGFVRKVINPEFKINPGTCIIAVDPKYYRPTEVDLLIGDASKAKNKLGWSPKYSLKDLIKEMVESDLNLMKKEKYIAEGGFNTLNYYE